MDTESASSSHSSAESDPSSSEVSLEYDSSSFTSEAGSSSDPEVLPFMYEPVVASASSHSEAIYDVCRIYFFSPQLPFKQKMNSSKFVSFNCTHKENSKWYRC